MNTWKTANAVVRHPEATIPIYDVFERGYSLYVTPGVRTHEGGLQLLEGLEAELTDAGFDVELRVRDDVGGWAR